MGKIQMKAVQQEVFNLNKSGEKQYAYVLRPTRYSTINEKQIVEYCVQNSMVPKVYVQGAMIGLAQCITNFLLNGHNVVFPHLGTFSLSSTGFAEDDVDKAGLDQLKDLHVRFLPCTELKALVEGVDVELDGIFDIAGETIIAEANGTTPAKTKKYYKRVYRNGEVEGDPITPGNTPVTPGQEQTVKKTITASASPSNGGTVTGGGSYAVGEMVTLNASPSAGYAFSKWDDGNTSASRQITVSEDKTYRAIFVSTAIGDEDEGH